jgi:hypothetical protein
LSVDDGLALPEDVIDPLELLGQAANPQGIKRSALNVVTPSLSRLIRRIAPACTPRIRAGGLDRPDSTVVQRSGRVDAAEVAVSLDPISGALAKSIAIP